MSPTEQKFQERVRVQLPIRVFGFDEARGRFNEDTNTIAVSPTGSLIALKHRVFPADVIRIVNLRNAQEADFRIVGPSAVGASEVAEWGVECTERERSIWGIAFPPLDPAAHVLLECLACRAQDSWPATLLEREVLDGTGIMARNCAGCGKPTYWTYADASQRPEAFTQAQAVAPPPRVMPVKKAAERRNRKRLPMKLPIYVRSKKDKEEIGTTENLTTRYQQIVGPMDKETMATIHNPEAPREPRLSGLEHFTIRDYKKLLLRRKWIILFTTLIIALGTAGVAHVLPNLYSATTVILVDPRKVPESYVTSTVTSGVADRLVTLRQQILSTTRLGQIIEEMGLYAELKKRHRPLEEIIETMRKAIHVNVAAETSGDRSLGAFSISYSSRNPVLAAQVTNRLASLFIEENIKAREQQVLGTADFIDRELDAARKHLHSKEERIRQLKTQNLSELPESQMVHLQSLSGLQLELRSEIDAVSRAQQQKVYVQSLLMEAPPVVNLDRFGDPALFALAQVESQLDELRKRYGPSHPEVLKKKLEFGELSAKVDEVKKLAESGKREVTAAPPKRRNPVLESQIAAFDEEIRSHTERQQEIRSRIAYHQSKLERIPMLEQEMASIVRDYEMARDQYKQLLDRKFSADMSSNLEVRQKGERFLALDPAQVPERPSEPKRLLIDVIGLVAGLAIGVVLAIGLELYDTRVKTENEVRACLQTSIFAEIPWLPTPQERRRQRLYVFFASTGATALATAYAVLFALARR